MASAVWRPVPKITLSLAFSSAPWMRWPGSWAMVWWASPRCRRYLRHSERMRARLVWSRATEERELVDHAEEGAAGMGRLVAAREGGLLQAGEEEAAQQALGLLVAEAAQVDDQDLALVDDAAEVQGVVVGAQHGADLGLEQEGRHLVENRRDEDGLLATPAVVLVLEEGDDQGILDMLEHALAEVAVGEERLQLQQGQAAGDEDDHGVAQRIWAKRRAWPADFGPDAAEGLPAGFSAIS